LKRLFKRKDPKHRWWFNPFFFWWRWKTKY